MDLHRYRCRRFIGGSPALRLFSRRFAVLFDLAADVAEHLGRPLEQLAAWRRLAQRIDFGLDIVAVGRQLFGEVGDLPGDDRTEGEDSQEGEDDGDEHRRNVGEIEAAEPANERREREAQEHRQGQRDKDVAAEIECRDGDHHHAQHQKSRRAAPRRQVRAWRGRRLKGRAYRHVAFPPGCEKCFGGKVLLGALTGETGIGLRCGSFQPS